MTTDYNKIAEQYKRCKEHAWRSRIEMYNTLKHLGDINGKKVVDMACGEGHFTRTLRQLGAAELVGFDISERMIELARDQEAKAPLGIQYRVEDARKPVPQQDFDLAFSAWLLVYARTRQELAQMCQGIASWLKPGGRFLTFTTNPDLYHFKSLPDYTKYQFTLKLADSVSDGAPIVFTIILDDATFDVENYYLPVASYEQALKEAGFRDFKVYQPELGPNPAGTDDSAFWADFLKFPPAIIIEAIKE